MGYSQADSMNHTALYHLQTGYNPKWTAFGNWELVLWYSSALDEWRAARYTAALFDVSHMGVIEVVGPDVMPYLDRLSTHQIQGKPFGSAIYTPWCREDGSCVDDVMVYLLSPERAVVVGNSANRTKDAGHMLRAIGNFAVSIHPHFEGYSIIALQGPTSPSILEQILDRARDIKRRKVSLREYRGREILVARTGYTGSDGYEIVGDDDSIKDIWRRSLEEGSVEGVVPAGLAARDMLRLEMGYALYGAELSDTIAPSESVAAWAVSWKNRDFIGKQALERLETSHTKRCPCALVVDEGIVRHGFLIKLAEATIGIVTSGGYSPMLKKGIALGLVDRPLPVGDAVLLEGKRRMHRAVVHKLPSFIPAS